MHASAAATASPPRATFPTVSRIHEKTDRRVREMAEAMVRLKAEHPDGCTETTLRLEGFSLYEQRQLGEAATFLANDRFVRRDDVTNPQPPSDESLIAEAVRLFDVGLDAWLVKLRALEHFDEDTLARIFPKMATRAASHLARSTLPRRIDDREFA